MTRGISANTSHLLQYWFFTALFVGTLALAFFIFKPFLPTIFLAVILAVACHPFYRQAAKTFRSEALAALATVLTVFALIIAPAVFFGYLLFGEVTDMYAYILSDEGSSRIRDLLVTLESSMQSIFPGAVPAGEYSDLGRFVQYAIEWAVGHLGSLFTSVFYTILNIVLMFLALSYFLKEGERITRKLVLMSPLKNTHDDMILKKIGVSINSVLRGKLVIAVVQGTFVGAGFAMFGVPSPVFFGFVAGFASLVPTVGTALVVVPAILYLFFTGQYLSAALLLAWGGLAVGLIDDIIGPYLIEREMRIHPFLILISALGGIKLFGPIGFIAGPVVLAVLFVLGEIYILITRPVEAAASGPAKK